MRSGWMAGWLVLALAACVSPEAAPPGVETVRPVSRAGVALPPAGGETAMLVRAVPAGAPGQELRGAACRAESSYFTAEFTAPARLLMPDYGAAAPVVTVQLPGGRRPGPGLGRARGRLVRRHGRLAGGRRLGRHRRLGRGRRRPRLVGRRRRHRHAGAFATASCGCRSADRGQPVQG